MPRRLLLAAALLLTLAAPAAAQGEVPRRVEFPAPESLLERDSVCVAVLKARAEDIGFRALLANAWQALNSGPALPPVLSLTLAAMGRAQDQDGLLSLLPAQVVRVDRLGSQGLPEPTFAFTVAGWQGLQALFFSTLTTGSDGRPLPTREHRGQTLVLREGWEDPTRARVLSRVKGTFLSCPTPDRTRQLIDLLGRPRTAPPQTSLLYAFQRLDASKDTYGALVNQEGSLMRFLEWLNPVDTERVVLEVGPEELEAAAGHAKWVTWEGDVVSDDQVDLRVKFESDTPGGAEQIAEVLRKARGVLARYDRAGHFQVGASGRQVDLYFSMIGFRSAVQGYVRSLR